MIILLPVFLTLIDEPNDNEKFDQIYSEYRNKMYYKALSMLRNPALAEEAVQESLLKIAENNKIIVIISDIIATIINSIFVSPF